MPRAVADVAEVDDVGVPEATRAGRSRSALASASSPTRRRVLARRAARVDHQVGVHGVQGLDHPGLGERALDLLAEGVGVLHEQGGREALGEVQRVRDVEEHLAGQVAPAPASPSTSSAPPVVALTTIAPAAASANVASATCGWVAGPVRRTAGCPCRRARCGPGWPRRRGCRRSPRGPARRAGRRARGRPFRCRVQRPSCERSLRRDSETSVTRADANRQVCLFARLGHTPSTMLVRPISDVDRH